MSDIRCYIERGWLYDGVVVDFQRRTRGDVIEHATVSGDDLSGASLLWTPVSRDLRDADHRPTLRLDRWEAEAFQKAIDDRHAPSESKALTEALAVERARVEKIIDSHVGTQR